MIGSELSPKADGDRVLGFDTMKRSGGSHDRSRAFSGGGVRAHSCCFGAQYSICGAGLASGPGWHHLLGPKLVSGVGERPWQ